MISSRLWGDIATEATLPGQDNLKKGARGTLEMVGEGWPCLWRKMKCEYLDSLLEEYIDFIKLLFAGLIWRTSSPRVRTRP